MRAAPLLLLLAVVVDDATADTVWPDLSIAPAAVGGGEGDAALIIGIEDYVFVDDVPGAVQNADDWYVWLKRTRELPLGRVVVLRNADATRERILEEARETVGRVRKGGTLWFVFIGHGAPSKDGSDGLMLGVDTQQTAHSVYARGVSQSELIAELEAGEQASTIVLLDTCFSGRSSAGDAVVTGLQPLVPDYAVQRDAATVLTAGKGDEFAGSLPGLSRPAFSYLALGALRGWGDENGDHRVTAREVIQYARGALVELVRDRRQTPQGSGPEADLVLTQGREAGPDLSAMVLALQPSLFGDHRTDGSATVSTGSSVDLKRKAAEAEQLRREREDLERREAELEQQLAEDRRRRRGEATTALLEAARMEWLALAPLLKSPSPEATEVAELYVEKYSESSVTVDGESVAVEVEQVQEARRWLNEHGDSIATGELTEGNIGSNTGRRSASSPVRAENTVDLSVKIRRKRVPGIVMMTTGGAAAAAGLILNVSIYKQYERTEDRANYEWASDTANAGIVIGIVGAATGVAGLIVTLVSVEGRGSVAITPGPVPTVSMEF